MNSSIRTLALVGSLVAPLTAWRAHPIHAARMELVVTPASVSAVLHVYRADFAPGTSLPAITAYLEHALVVTDHRGTRVVMRATAAVSEGDRLRIDLAGTGGDNISHGRIAVTLLQERYTDQVNVVDAQVLGHRAQLIFLRGDAAQDLP